MLTHHLATSVLMGDFASDNWVRSIVDDSEPNRIREVAKEHEDPELDRNCEVHEDHEPETNNEPEAQTSSITETSGLDTRSVKEQGIVSWAKNAANAGISSLPPSSPPPHTPKSTVVRQDIKRSPLVFAPNAAEIGVSPDPVAPVALSLLENASVHAAAPSGLSSLPESPKTYRRKQNLIRAEREIRTLEAISNRLTFLYPRRDRITKKLEKKRHHDSS
ncbi:hypothetical protein BDZ97DRAFT_1789235 [Flammula alnicola]|nr:hypothetical protein BDZ97DRAFT_1845955 [Flammula alnicola]KAF8970897.1 hypothetical protein BDZ97DRAFT_1789235 [Flammula alnicola]